VFKLSKVLLIAILCISPFHASDHVNLHGSCLLYISIINHASVSYSYLVLEWFWYETLAFNIHWSNTFINAFSLRICIHEPGWYCTGMMSCLINITYGWYYIRPILCPISSPCSTILLIRRNMLWLNKVTNHLGKSFGRSDLLSFLARRQRFFIQVTTSATSVLSCNSVGQLWGQFS